MRFSDLEPVWVMGASWGPKPGEMHEMIQANEGCLYKTFLNCALPQPTAGTAIDHEISSRFFSGNMVELGSLFVGIQPELSELGKVITELNTNMVELKALVGEQVGLISRSMEQAADDRHTEAAAVKLGASFHEIAEIKKSCLQRTLNLKR